MYLSYGWNRLHGHKFASPFYQTLSVDFGAFHTWIHILKWIHILIEKVWEKADVRCVEAG